MEKKTEDILSLLGMSPKEKKEYILQLIKEGNTQGYNSLMVDLELAIWKEKHG